MRLVLPFVAAVMFLPATAQAGGFGIDVLGGMHSERVYFYDYNDPPTQYLETQFAGTFGGGFTFVLGDDDDRLNGVIRVFGVGDAVPSGDVTLPESVCSTPAQTDCWYPEVLPDGTVQKGSGIIPLREDTDYTGVLTAGLQWVALGDPTNLALDILTNVGAGAITQDRSEFVVVELGVGGHYMVAKRLQVHAELMGQMRYRKSFSGAGYASAGLRYYFD